jgi:N-sulfoglucosamine sulfohydrolase
MKKITLCLLFVVVLMASFRFSDAGRYNEPVLQKRPNILFAISDDQSFPHASAYGQTVFHTPNFDSIAARGVLFTNAFVAAPQCSPSRAAILTGRNIWQLEEAGTHSSYFPKKFPVFTQSLEDAGYFIGYTGKAWGPGNYEDSGWNRNPVGPAYDRHQFKKPPTKGISKNDYAANFKEFLSSRSQGKPFFFWYGGQEPHRTYEEGSGVAAGLKPQDLRVPGFLPDHDTVRQDMLDYALEIEWFDKQLGKMLQMLKDAGELDNTVVVVTSDNGMAFPYAKANLQEFGTHVPLAICGPGVRGKNRKVDDPVGLIDLAPTFLDMGQVAHFKGITGKSLLSVLEDSRSGTIDPARRYVLTGRERHTHARPDNLGYPARAIRTTKHLYIRNFMPERWPMGDPPPAGVSSQVKNADLKPIFEGYEDIDDSPTKSWLIRNRSQWPEAFRLGFSKRGREELYDIQSDPNCLHNLANDPKLKKVRDQLDRELMLQLSRQGDPRVTGHGDIFDSYPRFGLMRPFDGFKERGKYNPKYKQQ